MSLINYVMDEETTAFLIEHYATMGRNFTPRHPHNFAFSTHAVLEGQILCMVNDVVIEKIQSKTCIVFKFMATAVKEGAYEGEVPLFDMTLATDEFVAQGRLQFGTFARYGIPEILALNDLRESIRSNGFYAIKSEVQS